jgi:hypothetical protein
MTFLLLEFVLRNLLLFIYLVIPLLGIYPKEHKSGYNRDTCTLMFIAALFTIVKLWKQPRCPSTDEWVRKYGVYIHNGVLFSHKE